MAFSLLCLENPLLGTRNPIEQSSSFKQNANLDRYLDIQAKGNTQLLEKYGLKANDAILAEEKHMGLYDDLLNNYEAKLIAGGAAQNTARGAQVRIQRSIVAIPSLKASRAFTSFLHDIQN